MAIAVAAKSIVKDFPSGDTSIRVLHGIDINIPTGQISMLVGPSGCGKTTLISILTGILTPTGGEVTVGDTVLTAMNDNAKVRFRRKEFGFIFQQFNLLPALTALENAAVVLLAAGMPVRQAEQRAEEILVKIGMGGHLHKLPAHLSGGQQQRVAIARALAHNPTVVVCDEPTASLDAASGQAVMEILRSIALDPGRAVIVVTHDSRIFHFADRLFTMGDGLIEREEAVRKESAS